MLNSHFGAIGINRGSLKLEVAIAGLVSAIALIIMIRQAHRTKSLAMPPMAVSALLAVFMICVVGPYTSESYLFPSPLDAAAMFGLPVILAGWLFWQCLSWGAADTNVADPTAYKVITWAQLLVFITGAWFYIKYHQDYFVNETEPLAVLIASTEFLTSVYTRRHVQAQTVAAAWIFALGNFLMYSPMALGNMSDPYPQADHGYGFPFWIFGVTLLVNIAYPLALRRRKQLEAANTVPAAAVIALVLLFCTPSIGAAQQTALGSIDGSVKSDDGAGIGGALVKLEPLRLVGPTDQNGAFTFHDVPAGTYVVVISLGDLEARAVDVRVVAGRPTAVAKELPRDFRVSMSTTVSAASKVQEQLLEAPVSMNVVNEKTVALEGGAGQLPSLLQTLPGAEFTQSGVYNIEFNSRGFNGALTRRVQVVVDGRDLAAPESKNQEWLSVGFLAPELESIEFVRGPAAALYGANSINGVMALTTKSPRGSPGGRASVTTGELGTFIGDIRWAGALGHDWYTRLLVDRTQSSSFAKSRTQTVEYPGLPLEVAPAVVDTDATSVAARFDKYFTNGRQLIIDTGYSQSGGGTYLSQAGRVSIDDSKRSWSRVALNAAHWTVQAYANTRNAQQHALFAPIAYPTDTVQFKTEAQGNQHFAGSRGRVVIGGSYLRERVDSADSTGVQTLYQRAVTTNESALFGQLDYDLSSKVKAVGAVRWDASTLHTKQVSPKVALVYQAAPGHSFHAGYSRGFQVGNYTELFLSTPLAPPVDLSAIEAAFAPVLGGVSLGFNSVPVSGIGNTNLKVEVVKSVEAGYVGNIGSRAKISVDVYRNSMRDFISDLLPGINPAFPAYHAPSTLPAPVRAAIEQTVNGAIPGLTNLPNGRPQVVYSNANFGLVTSRGVEMGGSLRPRPEWSLDASYTFFDFTLVDPTPGLEPKPNAPRHRAGFGATYDHARFAASINHRWVQGFTWASGAFAGPVPAYNVTDLNVLVRLTPHWQAGANISNIFDRQHYEMFGGDILRRRALAHLTVNW